MQIGNWWKRKFSIHQPGQAAAERERCRGVVSRDCDRRPAVRAALMEIERTSLGIGC
jgi:hypothetical protein